MNNELENTCPDINPATGLPMIEDAYIDVGGSPYGTNVNTWHPYDPSPCYIPLLPAFDTW